MVTVTNLRTQLALYIEIRGLTLSELSRRAKVPKGTIHSWISGKSPKNIDAIKRVADTLKVSLDHLLYGSGQDEDSQRITELDALLGDGWVGGTFEVKFRRVVKK